jgi:flagella basal body P-ring formation protein FlgA
VSRAILIAACMAAASGPAASAARAEVASIAVPQRVAAQAYVSAAREALAAELSERDGRFELETRGRYRDLAFEVEAPVRLTARVANTHALPSLVVWMELEAGGRIVQRVPVRFAVRWLKPALVAKRGLDAKAALAAELFELREVDVSRVHGGAVVASPAQLEGKRLRRDLAANAVLALADVEDRPPVEAGERIQVRAYVGRVTVQTTAIAERDGFVGARIAARVPGAEVRLRVEVTGENQARVTNDG